MYLLGACKKFVTSAEEIIAPLPNILHTRKILRKETKPYVMQNKTHALSILVYPTQLMCLIRPVHTLNHAYVQLSL